MATLAANANGLFSGKDVLHVSASSPETAVLEKLKAKSVTTLDIRPVCKPDIVADICHMPEVTDASFDVVLASCVLNHVYDDGAALNEIHRVLKDGGVFVTWVFDSGKPETIEIDDTSGWYGKETLEKYRVGAFRKYGLEEFPRFLRRRFPEVTVYHIRDAPSESMQIWYVGKKR